jgi:hypothetical protein
MVQDDTEYHFARAQNELNLGLGARGGAAARAHLQLSTLHMQRARELKDQSLERPMFNV